MNIRIFTTPVTDPWFNLATEDWVFNELSPDKHILFLWRNEESETLAIKLNLGEANIFLKH